MVYIRYVCDKILIGLKLLILYFSNLFLEVTHVRWDELSQDKRRREENTHASSRQENARPKKTHDKDKTRSPNTRTRDPKQGKS